MAPGATRSNGATRINAGANKMNTISKWTMALTLLAGAAYGQLPSTNDTSDQSGNTGMGTGALVRDVPGSPGGTQNTAAGSQALYFNTDGYQNTAVGYQALYSNTEGYVNTAIGTGALYNNTSGVDNTASGFYTLYNNTTGSGNAAYGLGALYSNSTGTSNTATGWGALNMNTTAYNNTATGNSALYYNTTGTNLTAFGYQALYKSTTGSNNTAYGYSALYSTTGSNNIALGSESGYKVTTGSNNIDIGNEGVAADNGVMRIGTAGSQKEMFISGIYTSKITGSAVYVMSNGRLGTLASSERYKTAIIPMGSSTKRLGQLRPVTFKLRTDSQGPLQYGLIAEEVVKVYPELVIRDENGRIDGVRYDELAPMLLNEVQKQQQTIAAQAAQLREMQQQLIEIRAALVKQPNYDQLVAQR